MKLYRVIFTLAALAALAAAASALAAAASPRSRAERIERGRYLTTLMSCVDCHTPGTFYGAPDYDRHLSGSELAWVGPWGVTFPRNLTPDVETGIGSWSEDDIVKAIRAGQRPDGSAIKPPMPWFNYVSMSDEDAYAIAAYLKSLPPVKHRVPDALPPGALYDGPAFSLPAPPAWDAPREGAAAHAPTKSY